MQWWSFATDLVGSDLLTEAQQQTEMSPRVTISQYQLNKVFPPG